MKYILHIAVLSCLFLLGCKTGYKSRFSESNRFINTTHYNYWNDSLRLSVSFAGDYNSDVSHFGEAHHNVISKKEFDLYKKYIQKVHPTIKIGKKNFVLTLSTQISPFIHSALFYIPNYYHNLDSISYDISKNTVSYSKQNNNETALIVFKLDKQYKDNKLFNLLKAEAADIFSTLEFGDGYKKIYPESPFKEVTMGDSANYLLSMDKLELIKPNYITEIEKNMWLQAALIYNSFVRNNQKFKQYLSEFYQPKDDIIEGVIFDDEAFDFLLKEIQGQQLVIMNEQHWQPKHRYLGNLLLKHLYDEGFRYLAVEGLSKEDEYLLNKRGFPLQSSGFYTKEPVYGNFIRNALRMGFKLISYDFYDDDPLNREFSQANIIYQKTFKKDPNAKVFVWCGIDHILKDKRINPRMGYYLKKLSGIDPLGIQQTSGDIKSKFLKNHFLAIKTDTQTGVDFDIFVYNNIKEDDFNILPDEIYESIRIPLSDKVVNKIKQHGQILLMIYNKDEFDEYRFEAVPVLNYLLRETIPPLIKLSKGKYIIIKRSPTTFIIEQENLVIN